jgi:hypothetical protein
MGIDKFMSSSRYLNGFVKFASRVFCFEIVSNYQYLIYYVKTYIVCRDDKVAIVSVLNRTRAKQIYIPEINNMALLCIILTQHV